MFIPIIRPFVWLECDFDTFCYCCSNSIQSLLTKLNGGDQLLPVVGGERAGSASPRTNPIHPRDGAEMDGLLHWSSLLLPNFIYIHPILHRDFGVFSLFLSSPSLSFRLLFPSVSSLPSGAPSGSQSGSRLCSAAAGHSLPFLSILVHCLGWRPQEGRKGQWRGGASRRDSSNRKEGRSLFNRGFPSLTSLTYPTPHPLPHCWFSNGVMDSYGGGGG